MSTIPDSGLEADDAVQRLKAGNARFVAGTARFPTVQKEILAELAKGQHPYATILSCSDSRVPPELIFDASFGELFIIRVAGNVLSPEIAGSLQYAWRHLRTPLFIVLGHTNCGAVAAAIDTQRAANGSIHGFSFSSNASCPACRISIRNSPRRQCSHKPSRPTCTGQCGR